MLTRRYNSEFKVRKGTYNFELVSGDTSVAQHSLVSITQLKLQFLGHKAMSRCHDVTAASQGPLKLTGATEFALLSIAVWIQLGNM